LERAAAKAARSRESRFIGGTRAYAPRKPGGERKPSGGQAPPHCACSVRGSSAKRVLDACTEIFWIADAVSMTILPQYNSGGALFAAGVEATQPQ
jgi:hypothetical protein